MRASWLVAGIWIAATLAGPRPVFAQGWTKLHDAALAGNLPRVKALMAKDPKVLTKPGGRGVFCQAAFSGNVNLVRYLLTRQARIEDLNYDGSTPLLMAASGGHQPVVELLLAKGARVKVRRFDGWTPLHAAASCGDRKLVELLVKRGCDPNAIGGRRRQTALQVAERYRFDNVVAYLEKHTKPQAAGGSDSGRGTPPPGGPTPKGPQ